jgi:hypothetical protein
MEHPNLEARDPKQHRIQQSAILKPAWNDVAVRLRFGFPSGFGFWISDFSP